MRALPLAVAEEHVEVGGAGLAGRHQRVVVGEVRERALGAELTEVLVGGDRAELDGPVGRLGELLPIDLRRRRVHELGSGVEAGVADGPVGEAIDGDRVGGFGRRSRRRGSGRCGWGGGRGGRRRGGSGRGRRSSSGGRVARHGGTADLGILCRRGRRGGGCGGRLVCRGRCGGRGRRFAGVGSTFGGGDRFGGVGVIHRGGRSGRRRAQLGVDALRVVGGTPGGHLWFLCGATRGGSIEVAADLVDGHQIGSVRSQQHCGEDAEEERGSTDAQCNDGVAPLHVTNVAFP